VVLHRVPELISQHSDHLNLDPHGDSHSTSLAHGTHTQGGVQPTYGFHAADKSLVYTWFKACGSFKLKPSTVFNASQPP
jgi:hypothetical protein